MSSAYLQLTPAEVMEFLHELYWHFDRLIVASGERVYKIETIGDW